MWRRIVAPTSGASTIRLFQKEAMEAIVVQNVCRLSIGSRFVVIAGFQENSDAK